MGHAGGAGGAAGTEHGGGGLVAVGTEHVALSDVDQGEDGLAVHLAPDTLAVETLDGGAGGTGHGGGALGAVNAALPVAASVGGVEGTAEQEVVMVALSATGHT